VGTAEVEGFTVEVEVDSTAEAASTADLLVAGSAAVHSAVVDSAADIRAFAVATAMGVAGAGVDGDSDLDSLGMATTVIRTTAIPVTHTMTHIVGTHIHTIRVTTRPLQARRSKC
jgi:hypothetical protein